MENKIIEFLGDDYKEVESKEGYLVAYMLDLSDRVIGKVKISSGIKKGTIKYNIVDKSNILQARQIPEMANVMNDTEIRLTGRLAIMSYDNFEYEAYDYLIKNDAVEIIDIDFKHCLIPHCCDGTVIFAYTISH